MHIDKRMIEWIQIRFGGSVDPHPQPQLYLNCSDPCGILWGEKKKTNKKKKTRKSAILCFTFDIRQFVSNAPQIEYIIFVMKWHAAENLRWKKKTKKNEYFDKTLKKINSLGWPANL